MRPLFSKLESPTLVIEAADDGFYLYTFPVALGLESDTWHQSLEDAQHQAKHEWPDARIDWQLVPDGVLDLRAFGRGISK